MADKNASLPNLHVVSPMQDPSFPSLTKQLFDQLEESMSIRAKHAGLLQHGPMTGDAREFVAKEVLEAILPSSLEIGRGKVIGYDGAMSRQVDIIVFDRSYPAFRFAGGSTLYPVEGVVATIEVKSTLSRAGLREALDNCSSVMGIKRCHLVDAVPRLERPEEGGYTSDPRPAFRTLLEMGPQTYIFAFSGLSTVDSVASCVNEWVSGHPAGPLPASLTLPRIVITGGVVMSVYGDPLIVHPQVDAQCIDEKGNVASPTLEHITHLCIETEKRFGWLATDILWIIQKRNLRPMTMRGVFHTYLPYAHMFNERKDKFCGLTMVPEKGL